MLLLRPLDVEKKVKINKLKLLDFWFYTIKIYYMASSANGQDEPKRAT